MNRIASALLGAIAGTATMAGVAYASHESRARRRLLWERARDKTSPLGWE